MTFRQSLAIFVVLFSFSLQRVASAQNADDYRGGWTTGDAVGPATPTPRVYEFSIRDGVVRGIYCTRCSDATTLAFLSGTLAADGLTFTVTHVRSDGTTTFTDRAAARFDNGQLIVNGTLGGPGGGKFMWTMHKDKRGPDPLPVPVSVLPAGPPVPAIEFRGTGQRGAPPAYVPPGPWIQLTPEKLAGVWIGFGSGINKQFFIIRRVGNRLRGMVCGRCDNPYTMAALDDFTINGDTLSFNILHEDWGPGTLPFHNQVTAHVASNEMRITTQQDNMPAQPPRADAGSSLMGPLTVEATAGNP